MAPAAKPVRAVVGIGASAGGIEALTQILRRFTHDAGAFVVVLHLSPTRESKLAEILARTTTLKVVRAQDGDELVPDNVYVLPEYFDIVMSSPTRLALTAPHARPRRTIDRFFCSLAEQRGHESLGVILSGSGTDGTKGLEAIRLAQGKTFVQDPNSALFSSMPESASPHADHSAEPVELGDLLMQQLHANHGEARGQT